MRSYDKKKQMERANILAEQRYLNEKEGLTEISNLLTESQMTLLVEGEKIDKIISALKKGVITMAAALSMFTTIQAQTQDPQVKHDASNAIEMVKGNESGSETGNEEIKSAFFNTSGQDRSLMASIISQDIELFDLEQAPQDVSTAAGITNAFYIANYHGTGEQNAKFINFISQNPDLFEISDSGIKLKVKTLMNKSGTNNSEYWIKTRVSQPSQYFTNSGNALSNS